MPDRSFLNWPFFEPRHREWAEKLDAWCAENLPVDHHDVDAACRKLVDMLGRDGWLKPTGDRHCKSRPARRAHAHITRETLARHDGLAGLRLRHAGARHRRDQPVRHGRQKQWLEKTRAGKAISAFALSEPRSGPTSPTWTWRPPRTATATCVRREDLISNGGIADLYVVRTHRRAPGAKGISAFLVPADAKV